MSEDINYEGKIYLGTNMKNKSIFRQMLIPMITIVVLLATVLVIIIAIFFTSLHEKEIQSRNRDQAELIAESIKIFVDAAYMVTEELATNPSILTMQRYKPLF